MKVNKLLFIILLTLSVEFLQAQEKTCITGKVINSDGVAIRNVNVVLFNSSTDTNIVALAATSPDGIFTIDNAKNELRPLRLSCIGFSTKLMLADSGNVGDIVLLPESVDIEGVMVVGSSKTFRPDGITYVPTVDKLKNSLNGMALLSAMQPPRVYVDPISFEVSVLGGGNVVLLINDRPVTSGELQGIKPEHIKRVEYYDRPSERFPQASVVINFTVVTPESGGAISANLIEGVNGVYGEHYINARVYSGRHTFTADWRPQFRYSTDLMRERADIFNLPTGTIKRNEIAIPAKQEYWNNRVTSHYNYTGEKYMFDLSAFGVFNNERHNDYSGLVVTENQDVSDTTINHDRNSNDLVSGGVNAYVEVKSPIGPIRFNADYSYRDASYSRNFEEQMDDSLFVSNSNSAEKVHFTGLQFSYSLPVPFNDNWMGFASVSSRWNCGWYSNSYGSSYGTENVETRQNSGESNLSFMLNGNNLMFALGLIHTWQVYSIDGNRKTWSQLSPIGAIMYKPTKKWSVSLDAMFKYSPPALGQIIVSEIQLDPYQIQRGNVNLGSTKSLQLSLNNNIGISNNYELFVQGKYSYYKDPIADISILEIQDNLSYMVVRMPANMHSFTQYTINGSLRGSNIWKFIWFNLWGGFDYAISNGGGYFNHKELVPFCQGQLTLKWEKWDLMSELWYGKADALRGELLQKDMVSTRFMLSYQHKRLRASVGVLNPFMDFKDTKFENLSEVAPYTRYAYSKMYNSLILAKLSFFVSWGNEQKGQGNPQLKGQESENTIVRSER